MSDWYETRLGDIADICIGGTPSRAEPSYWVSTGEEGFPWVSISDLKGRIVSNTAESITSLGARNSNVKLVPCGTIMMSFKLSLGRIAFAGRDIYTNEAIASFEVDTDKIDKTFLFYQLPEVVKLAITDTAIKGATLNKAKINELVIPHPELVVQRKIAEILSTIDNQIDATQALIDKYTAIKQGMMADLFSRGIDPETKALRPTFEEAPELYHKTPLGMLPKGWDVEVLGNIASIASGITLGKDLSGVRTVLVPYLRVANVQDGYLDLSEVKSIAVPEVDADKYVLQYGDVLMNEGGDFDKLGRGTVWREEIPGCCHQNHVFRVRADTRKLRFDYLAYWSASSFGKHYFVLNSKQSTNLASINSTQLKAFPVAKPTLEEQEEIESRLQSVDGLLRSSKDELHKLNVQKSGVMQDLLTGKVPVPA
jgi:type I restriction enzyme S subunit